MEVAPYIAVAVSALFTVGAQLLWPTREKRLRRALAKRPSTRVRDARGPVRLVGRVRGVGELLEAPLSRRSCVAYELTVAEPAYSGNGGMSSWRCCIEERYARPFILADESGEALVEPSELFSLALIRRRTGTTGWLGGYPGKHRALALLLEAAGLPATNWLGGWKGFRYAEGVLEEGDLVSVSGVSVVEVDPTGESLDLRSAPERLVLRGTEDSPLLIGDAGEARREPQTTDDRPGGAGSARPGSS